MHFDMHEGWELFSRPFKKNFVTNHNFWRRIYVETPKVAAEMYSTVKNTLRQVFKHKNTHTILNFRSAQTLPHSGIAAEMGSLTQMSTFHNLFHWPNHSGTFLYDISPKYALIAKMMCIVHILMKNLYRSASGMTSFWVNPPWWFVFAAWVEKCSRSVWNVVTLLYTSHKHVSILKVPTWYFVGLAWMHSWQVSRHGFSCIEICFATGATIFFNDLYFRGTI